MIRIKDRIPFGLVSEKEFLFYKLVGVHHFKKIVPFGDYWILLYNRIFSKKKRLLKSRNDAIIWFVFTLGVEFLHLVGFIVLIGIAINQLINEEYFRLFKNSGLNLIINVYPIMVQRYNRLRLIKGFNINKKDLDNLEIK